MEKRTHGQGPAHPRRAGAGAQSTASVQRWHEFALGTGMEKASQERWQGAAEAAGKACQKVTRSGASDLCCVLDGRHRLLWLNRKRN